MMSNPIRNNEEVNIWKWGGLAGMAGAALFVMAIVWVGVIMPSEPGVPAEHVSRFSEIKTFRIIENGIYLSALLLEIPLFLALHNALQRNRPASALFGNALCLAGILFMAVSATPHAAHAPLAVLFDAAGATPADQAAISIIWQAVWGVFNAMLYVGFFTLSWGLIILGFGLAGSPSFRKRTGRIVIVLGCIGLLSAVLQIIEPASFFGLGSYIALIVSCFLFGNSVFRLSRQAGSSHK